jgi:predicted SAM-dependent methyltransferase
MRKADMGARAKKTTFKTVPKPPSLVQKKPEPAPAIPELPQPVPIKLSSDIRVGPEAPLPGNGKPPAPAADAPKAPTSEVKLDLACGQSPREGFEGVDLYAVGAKHKVDLFKFPWPWADNSVDELASSHFLEHIPMSYLCKKHGHEHVPCEGAQDLFFAFMDECYRILKPQGKMHIVVPTCRSERAFQDPTHRRFIAQATFFYFSADWRKLNKLDHYLVKCNFSGDVNFSFDSQVSGRHEEVQKELFQHAWNVMHDWIVVLRAVK